MLSQIASRLRRNHGLEHATIHVLSAKYKNFSAQGNSDHNGFNLNVFGDLDEAAVAAAVREAHARLRGGERQLAIHPNCGTALLTTATLTTLAGQAALAVEQRRAGKDQPAFVALVNALPGAITAVLLALIVSRPLGLYLQARYTTSGDLGDLEVVSVRRVSPSLVTRFFHLLLTGGSRSLPPTAYRIETRG